MLNNKMIYVLGLLTFGLASLFVALVLGYMLYPWVIKWVI